MPAWIAALIGVVLGIILTETSTVIKDIYKARKYNDALNDELSANLHQLKYKEDIANQMIAALKKGRFLPGWSVPFASTVYEHHFPSIINRLKPIERDNVRHIYGQLHILDEITKTMEGDFKEDTKTDVMKSTVEAYIGRVDDVLQNYQILNDLISKYLDKKPVDIYQRNKITHNNTRPL